MWTCVFSLLGNILRSGIARSYGDSMFNILGNCQTVFQNVPFASPYLRLSLPCAKNTNAPHLHWKPASQPGETQVMKVEQRTAGSSITAASWAPVRTQGVGPACWVRTQRIQGLEVASGQMKLFKHEAKAGWDRRGKYFRDRRLHPIRHHGSLAFVFLSLRPHAAELLERLFPAAFSLLPSLYFVQ